MKRALANRIADAALYEGYILYPYRPSLKNAQRWTFGGLMPRSFCDTHREGDAWSNQTEVLIHGGRDSRVDVSVRFLHLINRRVGQFEPPLPSWPGDAAPSPEFVESLKIGDKVFHRWQEAEEREIRWDRVPLGELVHERQEKAFDWPGKNVSEALHDSAGLVAGVLLRTQRAIAGAIEMSAASVAEKLFRLTIRVVNRTPLKAAAQATRDDALLGTLVSAHTIVGVHDGAFVSLLDPPESLRDTAAACQNVGLWPVLVGETGQRDTVLASPIILYDYPQLAPESPGEFFDGTEIDEMLTLRIMTLTEDEKRSMAAVDERGRALLARTEAMARQQMARLHGVVRERRSLPESVGRE